MTSLLSRLAAAAELAVKKALFDCRACGQCVLRQTALTCPMRCPKGLRNGPCGGTSGGRCEVHPDQPCIWVRIDQGRSHDLTPAPLFDAPDPALFGTASVLNAISGADRPARTPLPWLDLGHDRCAAPLRSESRLEADLKAGRFVVTGEVRAPRSADTRGVIAEAEALRSAGFAAINTTAFLGGKPALPSSTLAAALQASGIEAIAQATGRDWTRTGFIGDLLAQQGAQVRNLLCLTGDAWHGGAPRAVYEMDAGLMLYEARHLAETGRIRFSGERIRKAPRPFLGAAINPNSTPLDTVVRRLAQKVAAGCDFIQTQVLTESTVLADFLARCRSINLHREVFLLAGIPVITEAAALEHLPRIPGVRVDPDFLARLRTAPDLREAGIAAAIDLARACAAIPGVHGVHLMRFGRDQGALATVRAALPVSRISSIPGSSPWPSPASPSSANASTPVSPVHVN